ncbi:arylsulfotransferase family protein [Halostella litorea]|uniref:arylsulfotransferase family protein n=1 Tax=Halostella litorea TaxID=2528831 RepID=UPI001092A030|nr:arylsulfotransferase family protein [Halostella litorea]
MNGSSSARETVARVRSGVTRRRLRVACLAVLLICGAYLAYGALTGVTTATEEGVPEAPPTENHTVVTESAKFGTIIAYAPDGSVAYYNNSHTKYFDVDPVENESLTVEYTATDTIHTSGPNCGDPPCSRNVIERANISTGEVTEMVVRYDHRENAGEWHDHVRVNETHVIVADIADDQVFMLDTESGVREWAWNAQSDFPVEGGGSYPGDWAHINDVSLLDDGRVMVSLRNQDQVVFIDPETGLNESWTLGEEDNHDIQYEQHNPDYIPEERGGPAVVVADSENGRVEEFQREDGEWVRTWEWSDAQMQWPRDADRLPNGNTLITDTNGKRLIEVTPEGEIVWEVELSHPYEAERLETGDESTGGESARSLGYESRTGGGGDGGDGGFSLGIMSTVSDVVRGVLPPRIVNGIIYIGPVWMGRPEFGAATIAVLTGLAWGGMETRWALRSRGVRFRLPVYRRGADAADDDTTDE